MQALPTATSGHEFKYFSPYGDHNVDGTIMVSWGTLKPHCSDALAGTKVKTVHAGCAS